MRIEDVGGIVIDEACFIELGVFGHLDAVVAEVAAEVVAEVVAVTQAAEVAAESWRARARGPATGQRVHMLRAFFVLADLANCHRTCQR